MKMNREMTDLDAVKQLVNELGGKLGETWLILRAKERASFDHGRAYINWPGAGYSSMAKEKASFDYGRRYINLPGTGYESIDKGMGSWLGAQVSAISY